MRRLYHISALVLVASLAASVFLHIASDKPLGANIQSVFHSDISSKFDKIIIKEDVAENQKPVKILVLGDMMFDRGVRSQINSKGFDYVFGPATALFREYDSVIVNLEGPITSFESKTVLPDNRAIPGFQFTFPANTASALKNAGIDIVSLANNHAYNFGKEGLEQTRTQLSEAGVQFFGSPENNTNIATSTCILVRTESGRPASQNTLSKKEICIGFVGWHEFGTKNYKNVLDEIVRLRPQVDYLIVFPHWGVEYEKDPTVTQIGLAHEWLNAGADAVMGAHPHVVQKIERYKTTDGRVAPIFYSLGNFIFDQYFSFDTTHGVGVEIEFDEKASAELKKPNAFTSTSSGSATNLVTTYKLIPFSSTGSRVSFPNASSTARIFADIEKTSGADIWSWLKK